MPHWQHFTGNRVIMSGPLMTSIEPVIQTNKIESKKTVSKAPVSKTVSPGLLPGMTKPKNPFKVLISGKPTEKDVREYFKNRINELMGDSSSDSE